MASDVKTELVQDTSLAQGLVQLKARRRHMRAYMLLSVFITAMGLVLLFYYQKLVYSFYDISLTVQQLHIPISAYQVQGYLGQSTNTFSSLFSWVMWLGLKFSVGLIGASIAVRQFKKINWFKYRIKGVIKHILAWLISFILIWTGLAALQAEVVPESRQNRQYTKAISYQQGIQQSKIYHYIQQSQLAEPVQDYLLAQTALLHRPIDKEVAGVYLGRLKQAELQGANFDEYGFKATQLWAMQTQVYGQVVTPFAQSIENQIAQANRSAYYVRILLIGLCLFFTVVAIMFYWLNRQFTGRIARIQQQIN